MVAPVVKAFGALVVGAPLALVVGLTARSLRKQDDAAVPMLPAHDAPVVLSVFSNYLDTKTHRLIEPTSLKKGYVAYDLRVANRSNRSVRGVRVELLDDELMAVGSVRLGQLDAFGSATFTAKKSWTRLLERHRVADRGAALAAITWKTSDGRRRALVALSPVRVLGEPRREIRRRRRARAPITEQVMS